MKNYLGIIVLILFMLYGIYNQIRMILIGKGLIKDNRFTEEDFNRLYKKGLVFLILEVLVVLYFAIIILGNI